MRTSTPAGRSYAIEMEPDDLKEWTPASATIPWPGNWHRSANRTKITKRGISRLSPLYGREFVHLPLSTP